MPVSPNKIDEAKRRFSSSQKGPLWTPRNKVLAILALIYLISPIDLLPDWLFPFVGWLDDVGVLTAVWLGISTHRAKSENKR